MPVTLTEIATMPTRRFLLVQRGAPGPAAEPPSPDQLQAMYAAFQAWAEKFKAEIVDMGGKLAAGGKVLTTSGVVDGPLVEAKEVIGGYMVVAVDDVERAVAIARECPGLIGPGSSCEIRELVRS
jgi:hypothetical protein